MNKMILCVKYGCRKQTVALDMISFRKRDNLNNVRERGVNGSPDETHGHTMHIFPYMKRTINCYG